VRKLGQWQDIAGEGALGLIRGRMGADKEILFKPICGGIFL